MIFVLIGETTFAALSKVSTEVTGDSLTVDRGTEVLWWHAQKRGRRASIRVQEAWARCRYNSSGIFFPIAADARPWALAMASPTEHFGPDPRVATLA